MRVKKIRDRIKNINLSIRKISEKAGKKEDIVRFDIGQPSFDTPEHVKKAAKKQMSNKQGYSPMLGLESLRSAIKKEEEQKIDLEDIQTENVMVTTGGMGALYSIFAARLESNDKAVFNDPCWGPYKLISEVADNNWSQVKFWSENGELRQEAKNEISQAELVVVNTPENPTGHVLTKKQAKQIAEFAESHDTFLISDEVYHRLTYEVGHYSPAAYSQNAAIIGSVSKNHAMTGWRVGWIIDNQENIEQYAKVSRASTACPPKISQYAAEAALKNDDHVEEMKKTYKERLELVENRLEDLDLEYQDPKGGIYVFPNVGEDSWDFCKRLVEEGVATVPGEPMGPSSNQNIRICFGSTSKKEIKKAFNILEDEIR